MEGSGLFINLVIVALLLFANAFFVATEFALVSTRKVRLEALSKEGNKDADLAIHSIDHLDSSIAATQLGITIASLGLGWVGEATLARLIQPLFNFLPHLAQSVATHSIAISIAFALITLMQKPCSLWLARCIT